MDSPEPDLASIGAELRQIIGDVVGADLSEVDDDASLLDYVASSLALVESIRRVSERFGIVVSIRRLLEGQATVSGLAASVDQALKGQAADTALGTAPQRVKPRHKASREVALAPWQHNVAFLTRYSAGAAAAYNECSVVRLEGRLDESALCSAIRAVGGRHEAVDSALNPDSNTLTIGHDALTLAIAHCPSGQLKERLAEIVARPFEPGDRLFRAALLQISVTERVLALTGHSLVLDADALAVVTRDIASLYSTFASGGNLCPAPALTQWTEYKNRRMARTDATAQSTAAEHWRAILGSNALRLELPTDHSRPPVKTYAGARLMFPLGADLEKRLKTWCEDRGIGTAETVFTACAGVLHRLTGQQDVLIGVETAPIHVHQMQAVVAATREVLPCRSIFDTQRTFADDVRENAALLSKIRNLGDLSLSELIQASELPRDQSRSAVFAVAFRSRVQEPAPDFYGIRTVSVPEPRAGARYDIDVTFVTNSTGAALFCDYSTELFEADTVSRWMVGMIEYLTAGLANDSERCGLLPIVTTVDRHKLLNLWNATQMPSGYRTVLDLISEHVEACPNHIAVRAAGNEITYAQLFARSAEIGALLDAQGVTPGDSVAVMMPRSTDIIAAIIAIWRARARYVPCDTTFPEKRLGFMLADAEVRTVITTREFAWIVENNSNSNALCLDEARFSTGCCSLTARNALASDTAYIMYTSGSTGQPKGVEILHSSLVNCLLAVRRLLKFTDTDSLLAITTVSFDISMVELFLPLVTGGVLEVGEEGLAADGIALVERIATSKPSYVQATPSTWKLVLAAGWKGDPDILVGTTGEAVSRELAEELLTRARALWNLYGPTETTVYSAAHQIKSAPGEPVHIGRPIANTQLYVLDDQLQLVPFGVTGELYIGGAGVARGYWKRPKLTEQRFIPNPFSDGGRLYRTGDLARYLPDGDIVCLGRVDDQVKIHGVRIETGEVEAALCAVPGVRDAVAVSYTDKYGDKQLVAHVIADESAGLTAADIRIQLRERLPETMIPLHIVFSGPFHMLSNGKIDRSRLPAPELSSDRPKDSASAPATRTERLLASVWSGILGIETARINRDDDFMELGGHSLLMTRLMVDVRRLFHVGFGMREFFGASTLKKFAALVDANRRNQDSATTQRVVGGANDSMEWGRQRMAFLQREAELPQHIAPARGQRFEFEGEPRCALLTGATGFLGAYIVSEILGTTNAHLHCLVRPRSGADGKERIQEQLRSYELWKSDEHWQTAWNERLDILDGDILLPRLGMSDTAYESLARDVDCIIHSAAHVNFIYPYEALRAANVLGVHEVIRFAFYRRIKPVHYLSTAAIWPMGARQTFYERDSIDHERLLNLGYDEAKWVAERCLLHAADRGLPVARYRPGEVGGDSKTGRCVLSHFIIGALKGFLQFGAFPAIDAFVDMTPVDYVAKAVVHLAFRRDPLGRAFHLTNPQRCHLKDTLAFLRSLGYEFKELPYDELRSALLYDEEFATNALFPYHAALESMDEMSLVLPDYDCSQAVRELAGSGIVCAPLDKQLMGCYMRYLRGIGYIPEPAHLKAGIGAHAS